MARYFQHVQLGGDTEGDPEHTGEISFLAWPGGAGGSSWGEDSLGLPAETATLVTQ